MVAVISLHSQTFLGHNQETYQELRSALQLNLRRQLLIAVCDDSSLQAQLAQRLETDLRPYHPTGERSPSVRTDQSPLVTLHLDGSHPDLVREVLLWLKQQRWLGSSAPMIPAFQILGVETLTRQSPTLQNRFLASLIRVDALLTQLDCRLLVWVPRPWLGKIQQAVPGFWRSRSGLYEFAGDPTPTPPAVDQHQPPTVTADLPQPQTTKAAEPPSAEPTQGIAADVWTMLREDLSTLEHSVLPVPSQSNADEAKDFAEDSTHQAQQGQPSFEAPTIHLPGSLLFPPPSDAGEAFMAPTVMGPLPGSPPSPGSERPQSIYPQPPLSHHQPPLPPLPPDLAEDDHIAHLWQYIQLLREQQAGPLTLARAHLALGQLSRDRVESGTSAPSVLEFTLEVYQRAIAGLLEGETDWCDALNDLASLYWIRSQHATQPQEIRHWLQCSVDAYQQAIGGQTGAPPATLSRLHSNLGSVYGLLANWGEPSLSLAATVQAYHQALQYVSAETAPLEYANLHNSLGAVHWRLAQLEQPQPHLHQAITAYSEALRYQSPQTTPQEYAMLQNNLGIAYWSLAQHDEHPLPLLEQAIAAYQAALNYRTLATTPAGCAATQNNLGTAYWDLAQQQTHQPDRRLVTLQQALAAYEAALDAVERSLQQSPSEPLGFDMWATFHSAGVVHDQLAQALPSDLVEERDRHLQAALSKLIV